MRRIIYAIYVASNKPDTQNEIFHDIYICTKTIIATHGLLHILQKHLHDISAHKIYLMNYSIRSFFFSFGSTVINNRNKNLQKQKQHTENLYRNIFRTKVFPSIISIYVPSTPYMYIVYIKYLERAGKNSFHVYIMYFMISAAGFVQFFFMYTKVFARFPKKKISEINIGFPLHGVL